MEQKWRCVFSPQTLQLGDAHLDRPGRTRAIVRPAAAVKGQSGVRGRLLLALVATR
ncbi:hypothetical protein BN2475_300014 [Paraburkholderia ribeironis]|uniref:Uncharacterized protein n=1 Tax=Paraburkholderia ribeironis TaxID=1247936 RepID=A0A1N7S1Z3_9BURK|nr:hypothetical protein BN2475_300014 [Paraburkholderia ribeironis]